MGRLSNHNTRKTKKSTKETQTVKTNQINNFELLLAKVEMCGTADSGVTE